MTTRSSAASNTSPSLTRTSTVRLMSCGLRRARFASPALIVCALLAQTNQIQSALTLTKQHRYKEADAALHGVAPPAGLQQQIAFHRLKAAIASGLDNAAGAAIEMEAALELAPDDPNLLHATGVAEAAAELLDPALAHLRQARQSQDSASLE